MNTLTLTPQARVTASDEHRTITGTIISYDAPGAMSTGPTRFAKGSLQTPADLSRVKLLVQHDDHAAAIGYATRIDAQHGVATFKVAPGTAGDQALAEAASGQRDGLSVGVTIKSSDYDPDHTLVVTAALLREVSLVTIPAFIDARVETVTAAANLSTTDPTPQQKETTMPDPTKQHIEGDVTLTPTDDTTKPDTPDTSTTDGSAAPEASGAVRALATASAEPRRAAAPISSRNSPSPAPQAATARTMNLAQLTASIAHDVRQGLDFPAIAAKANAQLGPVGATAALSPSVPTDDAGAGIFRPQWADELWQASRLETPFISAATSKRLTGLKVQGFKYDLETMPTVSDYVGALAEIPAGGTLKTVPVEATVVRRAGGWEIDRAYVDLGSKDFLATVFAAATDDVKRKAEAYVRSQLLAAAAASTADPAADFPAILAALGADAVTLGSNLSIIAMSPDVWLKFAALKESDVPWWLRNQGTIDLGTTDGNAGGLKFVTSPDLAAGTILAADSRAYTPYDEGGALRVQAANIANGGIDLGVYTYQALIINDPRAILKITGIGA